MALGLNKILSGGTTNTAGAYFSNVTLAVTTAGNVIPAGLYYLPATANVFVTLNTGNAMSNLFTTTGNIALGQGGLVLSDGVNVFANALANVTVTLVTVAGGANISGTFNAS